MCDVFRVFFLGMCFVSHVIDYVCVSHTYTRPYTRIQLTALTLALLHGGEGLHRPHRAGPFPHMSPVISGSFALNDVHDQRSFSTNDPSNQPLIFGKEPGQCVAVCRGVLLCFSMRGSVLQCVAVLLNAYFWKGAKVFVPHFRQ